MSEVNVQDLLNEGFVEAVSGAFKKWENVGDSVKGVCTDIYERENALKDGEMQTIVVVEQEDGEEIQVALKDAAMRSACKKLVRGQRVVFLYAEKVPAKQKGYNDFKLIKTYLGQIDEKYRDVGEIKVEEIPFE